MAKKAGRALSDNDMSNVSGGIIYQRTEDGLFKVVDDKTGKNVFNDKKYFKTLDEAVNAANLAGVSTEAITEGDHKFGKAMQALFDEE